MHSPLPKLAHAKKSLLIGVAWNGPDSNGTLQFLAPPAIDGQTIGGLGLRGTCLQRFPDENVMLQLEAGMPGVRTRIPLARLERRPLSEPHKNERHPDPAISEAVIWGTHAHRFDLNWLPAHGCMRTGNLPIAVEILPDLPDFESVIDSAESLFNISGLDKIKVIGAKVRAAA